MNRVTIKMKVLPEKRKELIQTIDSLLDPIRAEKGCKRCEFCQSREDENELCLLEAWDSRESFEEHMKLGIFKILQGAMTLLKEPYEMTFANVLQPEEMETTLGMRPTEV
jgi:quinol monooxygenase YgiN